MSARTSTWAVSIGLSLALGLTACGSGGDELSGEAGAGGQTPTRTTLEVVSLEEPSNLVPYEPHGGKTHIFNAMLMPLVSTDDQSEIYAPALDSWEVSDDARTVTFSLRPDVQWSDGTPMTSADVVMTLTQFLDPAISPSAPALAGVVGAEEFASGQAEEISGLSAPDDRTVVVELAEPNVAWLGNLAAAEGIVILPSQVLADVPHEELANHDYFKTFPVTSGPYTFTEWATGQHVELERNDNWSLGDAGFERVFIKFVGADVATAQLETREIQYNLAVDPADTERIGALEGIELESVPTVAPMSWNLMFYGPLLDRRVRQAMVYAIDREQICESVAQGNCTVPLTNIPQIGPDWAIPADGMIEYRYDPDRARELLDEAGWDPGTQLTFLNWYDPNSPSYRALTVAQDNMAAVGINWTMENVDLATLFQRIEEDPESFNGFPGEGGNYAVDPSVLSVGYSCAAHFPNGGNTTHYCNEELDAMLQSGQVETDPDRRAAIYQDALRLMNEEAPSIYLQVEHLTAARDSCLQGVKSHSTYGGQYWNIGEWHWEC